MTEPQTTPQTAKGSTMYVVLRQIPGDSPSAANTWTTVGSYSAPNDKAAIRLAATEGGAYVAIPKRSFKVTPVEVETQPRVRIVN